MTTSALTVLGAIAIAVVSAHPQQQGTGVPTTFDVASVRQNQDRSARTMIDEADGKLKADVKTARERIVTEAESLAREAAQRILGRAV